MTAQRSTETTLGRALKPGEIRLVSFLQGNSDDDLRLTRDFVTDLPGANHEKSTSSSGDPTQVPPYLALSYYWGTERTVVECDGVPVQVSANLVAALKALRKQWPAAMTWTDCLSINQLDDVEKAHQVSVMGTVYSAAELVVVWLGQDTEDMLNDLLHLPDEGDPLPTEVRETLVSNLATKEWFYRVWTFQEIRLATKAVVLLGSEVMDWEWFIGNILRLHSLEPHLATTKIRSQPRSFSKYTYISLDRFFAPLQHLKRREVRGLTDLLFLTWYRQASDKRDKVYALIGTALLPRDLGIKIDYKIPRTHLCIKAARACIDEWGSLEILRIAGMVQRWKGHNDRWDPQELSQLYSHPSWAPDWWTPPQQTRSLDTLLYDKRNIFDALNFCCPEEAPEQDVDDVTPFLILDGVLLGIINVDEPPTFPGGHTLIHPPPRCADTFPSQWLPKADAPHDSQFPHRMPNGIAKVNMSQYVQLVHQHMVAQCSCVPFHKRQPNPTFPPGGHHHASFSRPNPDLSYTATRPAFQRFSHTSFTIHDVSFPDIVLHEGVSPPITPEWGPPRERDRPAQVLATSIETGDWLVLLPGGGLPFLLRPARSHFTDQIVKTDMLGFNDAERQKARVKGRDAGVFVLVGEASMVWDKLWPCDWDLNCRAGKFLII